MNIQVLGMELPNTGKMEIIPSYGSDARNLRKVQKSKLWLNYCQIVTLFSAPSADTVGGSAPIRTERLPYSHTIANNRNYFHIIPTIPTYPKTSTPSPYFPSRLQ